MEYYVDQFRKNGVKGTNVTVKKCDCGNTNLKHPDGFYIYCPQCDSVYQVSAKKVELSESELNYVKKICANVP